MGWRPGLFALGGLLMEWVAIIIINLLLFGWLFLSESEIGSAIAEWIRRRP